MHEQIFSFRAQIAERNPPDHTNPYFKSVSRPRKSRQHLSAPHIHIATNPANRRKRHRPSPVHPPRKAYLPRLYKKNIQKKQHCKYEILVGKQKTSNAAPPIHRTGSDMCVYVGVCV
uniref:Uncharacterized protein n=1 Tax=Cacopsylla melanoneura TaxID=428564 RepID=A0A8D9AS79_9HEMI